MAWVMQIQQNNKTKNMAMASNNIYHLFQRCPCKMRSITSETGIHMYMMKAHEMIGVEERESFSFLSPVHSLQIRLRDHMTIHAIFMHSVCLYVAALSGGEATSW